MPRARALREKCFNCFRPEDCCLCPHMKPFSTKARVVILMHPKEAKRQRVGTGRISRAILKNSEIIMGVDFSEDTQYLQYFDETKYQPFILYPGEDSIRVDLPKNTDDEKIFSENKIPVIFVLDATWFFAKKMMRVNPSLHVLPRLSFHNKILSKFIIKQQPHECCLSTVESLEVLLNHLDKRGEEQLDGAQANLIEVFEKMVQYQVECSNNPEKKGYRRSGFRKVEDRKKAKKWTDKNFFYDTDRS